MVKKVGNVVAVILCLLASGSTFAATHSVTIKLLDLENNPIEKIAVGQSALLNVKIDGHVTDPAITINGLDAFYSEPRGNFRNVSRINGVTRQSHEINFLIRGYTLGTFTLGPVQCDGVGYDAQIEIPVVEASQLGAASKGSMFLEYQVQQDKMVVGQKIPVTVTLYSSVPVKLQNISLPQASADLGEFSPLENELSGIKTIDGKEYRYVSWDTQLIVHKAGKVVIPECVASCRVRSQRGAHIFGSLLFDMMGGYQEKAVYSQPLVLTVKDLPPFSGDVHGVGSFSDLRVYVDKTSLSTDEGAALTLQVSSSEYMDQVKRPELMLPEGIKYYNSSERIYKTQHGYVKTFEYILQPTKAGELEVQPQYFNFFNPETEEYLTLSTDAFHLNVHQGSGFHADREDPHQKDFGADSDGQKTSSQLSPINEKGPWRPRSERAMPVWFFALLTSMALLFMFYSVGSRWYASYRMRYAHYYQYKYAFAHAYKQLVHVEGEKNYKKLYELFIELFSNRLSISLHEVTQESLAQALSQKDIAPNEIVRWQKFFHELSQLRYGYGVDASVENKIIHEAHEWLELLEGKL